MFIGFSPEKMEYIQFTFFEGSIRLGCYHSWANVPTAVGVGDATVAHASETSLSSPYLSKRQLIRSPVILQPIVVLVDEATRGPKFSKVKLPLRAPSLRNSVRYIASVIESLSVDRPYTGLIYFRWQM